MWKTSNGYVIHQLVNKRGSSCVFLIASEKGNIMVDAGAAFAYKQLQQNSKKLKLQSVNYLILTHTHFDHVKNVAKIKEKENCKIILSEKDKDFVKKGYTPIPGGTNNFTRFLSNIGKKIGDKWFGYKTFEADIWAGDFMDMSAEGFNIQTIATKGHTEGSISVIVDNEIAIVGDTLINIYKKSIFPPFADNPKEMIKSWKKLLDTGCRTFLPGHGKPISRAYLQKEYDKYKSIV